MRAFAICFVAPFAWRLARRNRWRAWRWAGRKLTPHIPPRYGVTISGCTFGGDKDGPGIHIDDDLLTIRGGAWIPMESA